MRHAKSSRTFSRSSSHQKAMFANMTSDLIKHGRISTTVQKAKELRKYVERMVTLGKAGDTASRRRAFAFLRNKDAVTKLFVEVAPTFKERPGGYTRILKTGIRHGDAATMSIIEFVEAEFTAKTSKKKPKKTNKIEKKAEATPAEETTAETATDGTPTEEAAPSEEAPAEEAKAEEVAEDAKTEEAAPSEDNK